MMDRKLSPLKIVILYAVSGLLWILFSDLLLSKITKDTQIYTKISIVKGWLYVILTAALLYWLVGMYSKQRTQSEIALRENEQMFRSFFEAHSSVMILIDPDTGDIVDANRAAADFYGFSRETLRSMAISDINVLSPEELTTQRRRAAGAQCNLFIFPHRLAGGEIKTVEVYTSPIEVNQKKLLFSIIHDITERKRAEDEIRESQEQFKALTESTSDWIWEVDEEGRYTYVSPRIRDLLGYEPEEVVHKTPFDLMPPEEAKRLRKTFASAAGRREPLISLENTNLHKDGHLVVLETSGLPFFDAGGKFLGYRGIDRDITERKRVEDALRESEERYRTLAEATFEGITLSEGGVLIDANSQLARLLGYELHEIIGKPVTEFIFPEDRELVRRNIDADYELPYENRLLRKDGSTLTVETRARHFSYQGRNVRVTALHDITERKLAEEDREKLQAQLLHAQKMDAVGRLAGGVAHDFNNMLSAILGYTEMAMMECTPSETIHAHLKVIEESALRSADLVRQLLAFARKQTAVPKVMDLNNTVAGLLKMLQRLMGEDIDFAWMPGAALWLVKIDPSQIDQLLANLCVNARDAIVSVGKITIETENAVFDEGYCAVHPGFVPGEYVMLAVSDNGCGMSKEVIDHLFEPFFTTKEAGKGTGLGLATVYGIVKQNEGFINVYSEPGKGSTFKIFLPRSVGEAIEPMAVNTTETPKGRGETVLLVEDEALILSMSQKMLEALGYRVLTASTPGEALRQVKAHASEIQLLITDVVMPEMNGLDLARLLREINPGLKCLFSSGYTANVIAHRGILDEGMHFLQKPFCMKDLATKVCEALERE
ncbi:MAG: PAS domain S-box protein [Thermodesulfovibrionales bacterium]